jgi:hypothetical protein
MAVNVTALNYFQRKARRLTKKFRTLDNELAQLIANLKLTPRQGKDLGSGLYKIRLASKSKGTGKSGGFRVVTYYVEQVGDDEIVYLVTIYDKSEEVNIKKTDLLTIVQDALGEEPEETDE